MGPLERERATTKKISYKYFNFHMHKDHIRKYSESKKKKIPNFLCYLKTVNTSKGGKGE